MPLPQVSLVQKGERLHILEIAALLERGHGGSASQHDPGLILEGQGLVVLPGAARIADFIDAPGVDAGDHVSLCAFAVRF